MAEQLDPKEIVTLEELDTSLAFQFPVLLAPNFTVPLFALAHVFALVKLF
ncbi:MAG: hypothetical protein V3U27_10375 [Candidatus Tectomicrobia bacterium]